MPLNSKRVLVMPAWAGVLVAALLLAAPFEVLGERAFG